jgi:hypothetical protein
MQRTWQSWMAGVFIVGSAGCSSHPATVTFDAGPPDAAPIIRTDDCAMDGFRVVGDAGTVVCPGTPTCSCGGGQVCCMAAIDTQKPGTCETLEACRTTALQCMGSESCNPGDDGGTAVCCLDVGVGGGTTCQPSLYDCFSRKVLCHGDSDCLSVFGQPFCRPADFGTGGISDRGLDGLIGICSSQ